jgi:hypothetical protein
MDFGCRTRRHAARDAYSLEYCLECGLAEAELAQRLAEIGTITLADRTAASAEQFVAQELDQ